MRKFLSLSCVFLFVAFGTGCKDNPVAPPPDTASTMSIQDASCTEAVISISIKGSSLPLRLTLKRNDSTIALITLSHADTVYIDTLLQPGRTYTYTMLWGNNTRSAQVRTKDTTSHDYSWQTFEFGEVDRSMFYDVTILNEDNIWAVGEIYFADPLGIYPYIKHGAVCGDGKNWITKRLRADDVSGVKRDISPVGIYAIDTNNIWFGYGDVMHYLNGTIQSYWLHELPVSPSPILDPGQKIWKICGTSASSVLAVGTQGALAFYDGVVWKKLETVSAYDVSDVCAVTNPHTGKPEFYCSIDGDRVDPSLSKLIRVKDNTKVETIPWGMDHSAISIWTKTGFPLFVAGGRGGIYTNKTGSWTATSFGEENVMDGIRGNDVNDLMVIGGFGLVAHYNGATWRRYPELGQHNERYQALYMTEHLAAVVGYRGGKAIISIGKR